MGRKMLSFGKWKSLKIFFSMTFRNLSTLFKVRFNDKDVSDFFMNIVKQTIEHREKTGYQRKDFMQLLIDLMKKDENDVDKLTFNEIVRQYSKTILKSFAQNILYRQLKLM
jgi:cytochrome P450 family 6